MTARRIKRVIIHCTYTPQGRDYGVKDIDKWHKKRGWSGCGYHRVIRRTGVVEQGRPLDEDGILEPNEVGAHAKGHNLDSIAVALVGGMKKIDSFEHIPDCNFTQAQWRALAVEVAWLEALYGPLKIVGHRDLNPLKACPCFDVKEWRYG